MNDKSPEPQGASQKQATKTDQKLTLLQSKRTNTDVSHAFCKPVVVIESPEKALHSSKMRTEQPHRPDAYELSFWTEACLPGPKIRSRLRNIPVSKQGLCGFCVVHHRWDVRIPRPGEPDWETNWWLSGYLATGAFHLWSAKAMAVIQALRMAVDHCERASGTIVTPGRPPSSLKQISAKLPTAVNIFSDHPNVMRSLGGMSVPDEHPENQWLIETAKELIALLATFRVGVNLRTVPGHSGDQCHSWAHQGAHLALNLRARYPKGWSKQLHRVMLKVRSAKRLNKGRRTNTVANDADEREFGFDHVAFEELKIE